MSPLYAIVLMWSILLATLFRAWWKNRLSDRNARSGWIQMILATLLLTLQGEAMELAIDRWFANLPVTLYIKHFCLVTWFWLYLRIMAKAFPHNRYYRVFFGLMYAGFVGGIVTFPLVSAIPIEERSNARELVVGLRDALMILPVVLVFIPGTFRLAKRERVPGTKTKTLAVLIGYCAYTLIAVTNIANALIIVLNQDSALPVNRLLAPVLVVSLTMLVSLYLPYHLLTALWYPHRLLAYWRLRQLEKHVMNRVAAVPESRPVWELLRAEGLELAIYRATINILDYSPLLQTNVYDSALYQKIQQLVESNASYPDLVQQLVMVRV